MEMSSANEIRYILNEIDLYTKYLKDIKQCTELKVTILDNSNNGCPTTFNRDSIEVKAIIKAYENHIEELKHRIHVMKWVGSNE
jgi:hypothetical protein